MQLDEFIPEALFETSLDFTYLDGGITEVSYPSSTGWRVLPYGVLTQILDGRMLVETTQGFHTEYADGECLFIPPDIPHCITAQAPCTAISRWAHVRYSVLNAVDLLALLFTPHIFPTTQGGQLGDFAAQLVRLHEAHDTPKLLAIVTRKALGFQLLATLLKYAPLQSVDLAALHGLHRMLPVLNYVQEHLSSEITRGELANLLNLSPTRFYTVFKRCVGMSPSEYVKHTRIRHAQRQLLETDDSIAQIARDSGFPDAFNFSRMFKAACGQAPSRYRGIMKESLHAERWT